MALRRTNPPKSDARYCELWAIVDEAVAAAFACHPDYLTDAGQRSAQISINKRVVGALLKVERSSHHELNSSKVGG
jgi:hypothetical protein